MANSTGPRSTAGARWGVGLALATALALTLGSALGSAPVALAVGLAVAVAVGLLPTGGRGGRRPGADRR
ncbi:hypothetical protein [Kineococcus gypseus]|uniref:hypothetical protein n=1 Tax=Kineococcus gypseus TaxID=1637102 RepID=UPI003D7CA4E9